MRNLYDSPTGELLIPFLWLHASNSFSHISSQNSESDTWFGERRWVMAEVLYSCLVFINTELFSTYASWSYEHIQDRLDIGHSIMTIYNLVLCDSTWTKSPNEMSSSMTELSDVREYLVEGYLSGRQGYYLSAFLDLISTGNEMPLMFYKKHQIKEAACVEQTIISALDFLERLVSIRVFQKRPISACELTIMQRSVEGSGRGADVIQTIGRYVNYEFNPSIPLKAIQVLTMIATVAHESEAPLPSFVGYFGDEARHIVSSMILLLKDDLAMVNSGTC